MAEVRLSNYESILLLNELASKNIFERFFLIYPLVLKLLGLNNKRFLFLPDIFLS